MTIIELTVSMAVLVIMILMANMLLVQARRTVRLAQDVIRANADVRAVADRVRADLYSLTKDGFLAINYDGNGLPRLVFTSVSTFRSIIDESVVSNFSRIDYGLTVDGILYRRAFLEEPNTAAANDHLLGSLAGYRLSRTDLQAKMTYRGTSGTDPTILDAPPLPQAIAKLSDANTIWPYLIAGVKNFRIQWTDGARPNGPLEWYDFEEPKADDWADKTAADGTTDGTVEYDFADGTGSAVPVYGALWTWHKKDAWPKAIRLQMELGDDPPRLYQIVVDLPN